MALPETREGLEAAGYVFDNESYCSGKDCRAPIEWWISTSGRKMPFSVIDVKDTTKTFPQPILRTIRQPHHMHCPNVGDFRRKR